MHHTVQGFVDLAVLCSFSRMVEALGIPRSGKEVKVSEEKVAEVRDWPPRHARTQDGSPGAWHRQCTATAIAHLHGRQAPYTGCDVA